MARISHLRDARSFRRKPGQKPPRSITLIVCEGETEREYFNAARARCGLSTAEVVLAEDTKGSAPINVVDYAERKCKEPGGFDKVFCVFDRDKHATFQRARDKIKALAERKNKPLPVAEAVSIPCFEVWVLLHFERTDMPFSNCDSVIQRIRANHLAGYNKTNGAVASQLMTKVDDALLNAEWLEARAAANGFNPYTSVHRVMRHFEAVAAQK